MHPPRDDLRVPNLGTNKGPSSQAASYPMKDGEDNVGNYIVGQSQEHVHSRENQNHGCGSLLQKSEMGIRRKNCKGQCKMDNRRAELDSGRKTRTRKT